MDEHTRDPTVGPPAVGDPTGWNPEAGEWEHGTLRRAVIHGVPTGYYGVDVLGVRTTLTNALDEPATVEARRIELDGQQPEARPADYTYAADLG